MAFGAANKTLIFEILGMFEIGNFDWFQFNDRITGEITSVPLNNQIDFTTAKTQLDTNITAAEAIATLEARIIVYLAEYEEISLDMARIGPGGGGGAAGARYNPVEHRAHLRSMVEQLLGFQLRQEASSMGFIGPGSGGVGGGPRNIGVTR